MSTNARSKPKSVAWDSLLCVLAVLLAAAAPFFATRAALDTSAGDEIGCALLGVALVALAMDRRL